MGQRIDGVAAVVDNEVVLQSEVDEQLYLFLQQQQGRPDSSQVQQLRKDILDKLIDDRVIVSEAKRQNLTASEAEIEKQVSEAIADTKKRLGSDEAFASELRREGLSEEDLKKRYREEVQKQLLANRAAAQAARQAGDHAGRGREVLQREQGQVSAPPGRDQGAGHPGADRARLAREGGGEEARQRRARAHQEGRAVLAPRADAVRGPGHGAVGRRPRLVQARARSTRRSSSRRSRCRSARSRAWCRRRSATT
jgi:hypothetical protein